MIASNLMQSKRLLDGTSRSHQLLKSRSTVHTASAGSIAVWETRNWSSAEYTTRTILRSNSVQAVQTALYCRAISVP